MDPTTPSPIAASGSSRDPMVAALEKVLQPAGWELLKSLPPYSEKDALPLGARLRAVGHDPDLVAAVLTQSRLRARAVDKFGEFAASMLFTPDGLEQATRLPVAALHARRFRSAGIGSVADLGCGIGGDAMAMAGLGTEVLAVDRDPATVAVATVNLRPFETARVRMGAAEGHDPTETDGIWLDPARRAPARSNSARGSAAHGASTDGRARRIHDPEEYEPPLAVVADLARRLGRGDEHGPLGAKLAPGIDHEALPAATETQWLSWHGQVLEATCWFGPLATPGVARSALVVTRDGAHRLEAPAGDATGGATDARFPDPEPGPLRAHVYEPDGAVIRAGLIGLLARDLDGRTVDPTIAYLTSDQRIRTPFARGYAVRDVFGFSLKRLGAYLREHRIGVLEIKKRGTAVEPEELRRKLRPRRFGDESATLILTRIAGEQSVIIASPHAGAGDAGADAGRA